jgi:fatty-acyl-CoA synthase
LQYTSGSTSEPKGVMIPDRVLSANIDAIAASAGLAEEVMVSWLPLYHDMGLVGFLAIPMTTGVDLVLAAPQDFLAHPAHWMQWISDWRGTVTAGPNFSWVLATRGLRRASGLDLSSLTLALSGAEPVDPDAMDAFVAAAEPHGFRAGAVFPAFGMAEVAIAGTFPPRGRGMVCDTVDRVVLERDHVAKPIVVDDPDDYAISARRLPLLGRAIPGLEIRVVDPDTFEERPERHVGELVIRGTSVTPGYYRRADATAALFRDGWLRTGDLAYQLDGELVLCGRIKDVIIVGGRNVFPEDIERAIGAIDGVRAGNVIAVGVEGYKGKESVVVVAEVRIDGADFYRVRADVHHRTLAVCGIPPRDVMLVRPGSLPKTSSGKLQRAKCRDQYLNEELMLA